MELNSYQRNVINDLQNFLEILYQNGKSPYLAFNQFWSNHDKYPLIDCPAYNDDIKGVPNICVKVPTAGGKTFIAANALHTIFSAMEQHNDAPSSRMVVWLVPSETILSQTFDNLSKSEHPYRKKITSLFGGDTRVQVLNKEAALSGTDFSPDIVQTGITILVMTFDSLKGRSKEVLRSYRENSNLDNFANFGNVEYELAEYETNSLINVLRKLTPVLIVDESHHTTTQLSRDMLAKLNPCFIFELTATPKETSNIISYVRANELKQANMVKLPVIVSKQDSKENVIMAAIVLRENLEKIAIEQRQTDPNAKYIRPIVLFQAEPRSKDDHATFDKIKQELINLGIPETQIAIKTSEINEIKNVDLLSPDCAIRFVITVNALKEGWDCPFAYILASLANKSSVVDVTQIIGRILRQPYSQQHTSSLLNSSFVFTSSGIFQETLKSLQLGLEIAGFSKDDYRSSSSTDTLQNTLPQQTKENYELPIQPILIGSKNETSIKVKENVVSLQEEAKQIISDYSEQIAEQHQQPPHELQGKYNMIYMNEEFISEMKNFTLPQFFIKIESKQQQLFDLEGIKVHKNNLLHDLRLPQENSEIDFKTIGSTIYKGNSDKEGEILFTPLKGQEKLTFIELFKNQSKESQLNSMVYHLMKLSKRADKRADFEPISEQDIQRYFERVVSEIPPEDLLHCYQHIEQLYFKIKTKIQNIMTSYAAKNFFLLRENNAIFLKHHFKFDEQISPTKFTNKLEKSLYNREADMNAFEASVLGIILENSDIKLRFWHRIDENRTYSFYINAFINHYPDFLFLTEKGTVILLETKKTHWNTNNAELRLRLGKEWENAANQLNDGRKYKYFMVFEEKDVLTGSVSVSQVLNIMKDL